MYKQIAYKGQIIKFNGGNNKVAQVGGETTDANYEILLSNSPNDTTEIASTKKASGLTYNPSTNQLKINGTPVLTQHQDISGKVNKSGDTMTGNLNMTGGDICLKTSGSSSDDSSDLVWFYGNNQEKMRIWTPNEFTTATGPSFRVYKKDGTSLYSGRLAITSEVDAKVSKSSDTMTGNLTQSRVSNSYYISKTNTYAKTTASNNGVTSNTDMGGLLFRDKNDSNLGDVHVTMGSNGNVWLELFSQNMRTDGTTASNVFNIITNKDGSATYSMTSPANFRRALEISIKNIAVYESHTDNFTVAANGSAECSITLASHSGWTPLEILNVDIVNASSGGTLYSWCTPYHYGLNGTTKAYVQVRNHYTGGAAKIRVTVRVLYYQ